VRPTCGPRLDRPNADRAEPWGGIRICRQARVLFPDYYRSLMVALSAEVRLSATGSVGYPSGHDWNIHWLKTTMYLARLREVYRSASANNIDLIAIVDAFMIACTHMYDAFKNDPGLASIKKADVDAAMAGDEYLRLCRDYANTAKHLKRKAADDIEAAVLEAGSRGVGNFVTIAYGPSTNPRASTTDALDLAEAAYAAWQTFMKSHGIQEQSELINPLLNPPPD